MFLGRELGLGSCEGNEICTGSRLAMKDVCLCCPVCHSLFVERSRYQPRLPYSLTLSAVFLIRDVVFGTANRIHIKHILSAARRF
jgi:hypothetical protein